MLIKERPAEAGQGVGSTVDLGVGDLGIVVLDEAGRVVSANMPARALLGAESAATFDERLRNLWSVLAPRLNGSSDEIIVDIPGNGSIGVRVCGVAGTQGEGQVLLLRDWRWPAATTSLMHDASRHRVFALLARDWAHDLKGMLHVIRINAALLGRLLQRTPEAADAAVNKCLDAVPREVERLDGAIELTFGTKAEEKQSTFDVGRVCERLRSLIGARATRQRVEVLLELTNASKDVVGVEEQVQCALLNVILDALERIPEQGRLVIRADGNAKSVTVRISDTGDGTSPYADAHTWRVQLVNDRRRTAIGLYVARDIVEAHDGRIACTSSVPGGTCVEITFPSAASTERLSHASRTHR